MLLNLKNNIISLFLMPMVVRFLCLLFFGFLGVQSLLAQHQHARFTHLTTNQGLSQNTVTCILQDRRGFMWFWDPGRAK